MDLEDEGGENPKISNHKDLTKINKIISLNSPTLA
jgi:hypothetical protein